VNHEATLGIRWCFYGFKSMLRTVSKQRKLACCRKSTHIAGLSSKPFVCSTESLLHTRFTFRTNASTNIDASNRVCKASTEALGQKRSAPLSKKVAAAAAAATAAAEDGIDVQASFGTLPFVPRGEEQYSAGDAWKCLLE
jgi:hypothetical protein